MADNRTQAARVGVGLMPPYRRSPMALEVAVQPQQGGQGGPGCTLQLLSLGDTFAAISRLADQTKPEPSPSQRGREVCASMLPNCIARAVTSPGAAAAAWRRLCRQAVCLPGLIQGA